MYQLLKLFTLNEIQLDDYMMNHILMINMKLRHDQFRALVGCNFLENEANFLLQSLGNASVQKLLLLFIVYRALMIINA